MGLFQKKPQVSNSTPLYTLGLNKTVLVIGLGNPGKNYHQTRHNSGFECVDEFVRQLESGSWVEKKDLKVLEASGFVASTKVIVVKPTTFMNSSGEAVQAVMHFYKLTLGDIIVVHDELDIPFGQIRTRKGGSDAGHNGVKSLIQHIGEDFNRVRVGIGNEQAKEFDNADFVLGKFSREELSHMKDLTREVSSILTEFIASGTLPHDTRSFLV